MPPPALHTHRSQFLHQIMPTLRKGVRAAALRPDLADDALQQSILELLPKIPWLAEMPDDERFAYVYRAAWRVANRVRQRMGKEQALGSAEEVRQWERSVKERTATPEQVMRAAEAAEKAVRVFQELDSVDQRLVHAVNIEGLSERDAAEKEGIPRGTAAYRLRRAREKLARVWMSTTSLGALKRKR